MAYEYPSAGKNAQPEVKKAIERFRRLPDDEKEGQVLLWWLTGGQSTQAFKMTKRDAGYVDHPVEGAQCSLCKFAYYSMYEKKYICSQIVGEIFPNAVCQLFED